MPARMLGANRLSPTLVVYQVTCKGSARVVQVECLENAVPASDPNSGGEPRACRNYKVKHAL